MKTLKPRLYVSHVWGLLNEMLWMASYFLSRQFRRRGRGCEEEHHTGAGTAWHCTYAMPWDSSSGLAETMGLMKGEVLVVISASTALASCSTDAALERSDRTAEASFITSLDCTGLAGDDTMKYSLKAAFILAVSENTQGIN